MPPPPPLALVALLVACAVAGGAASGAPCAARAVPGADSILCVCNSTYCDKLLQVYPQTGQYIKYTSNKSGRRFEQTSGVVTNNSSGGITLGAVLTIDLSNKYQEIIGFGGAFTDSAGINYKALPDGAQKNFMGSCFSEDGLAYNMGRVPIGGCDFSTHPYAYNETPENDTTLSNYTLSYEDYQYKVPMINEARNLTAARSTEFRIFASCWSPPGWMKDNNNLTEGSLLTKYYGTYAEYIVKFMQAYSNLGVPIWGLTTTNEPDNALLAALGFVKFNSLSFTPQQLWEFVSEYLVPAVRASAMNDIKIIYGETQRPNILRYAAPMGAARAQEAYGHVHGIAYHWYMNSSPLGPVSVLDQAHTDYPDKFILPTEACNGAVPLTQDVKLGDWSRAEAYVEDIIENLNHWANGWVDWNLSLDTGGGPNWVNNNADSPIIVNATAGEFYKQPMYYALAHVSKFLKRGSQRVDAKLSGLPVLLGVLKYTVFLTPEDTIVLVLYNSGGSTLNLRAVIGARRLETTLEPYSINTIELPAE